MKLLFAQDHRFRWASDGRVWTTGAFASGVWQRYLQAFDSVTVVGRDGGQAEDLEGFARADRPGVEFAFLRDIHGLKGAFRRASVGREIDRLVAQSDAVVARLGSEFGLAACAAARAQGKPYMIEVAGSAWDAYVNYGNSIGKLYAPIAEQRVKRAVRKAPLVVYVTRSWLQTQYPTAHPEIPLEGQGSLAGRNWSASGVTNAAVSVATQAARENRERRLAEVVNGRPIVLGTIGNLNSKYKGIHIALPALARLRNEGLDFTYRVLGGGDPLPWQALIDEHGLADRCFLDGTRPAGEAVLNWLDGIDLYVHPSMQEGLPRSVLEAMSRGVPCIGSTAGGTPELIAPGFVHKAGNGRQLEQHLRTLLRAPDELRRLSAHSFSAVMEFAPERVEAKRSAMLHALAAMARPPGMLFIHDHMFTTGPKGEVWTGGSMPASKWQRFLDHFSTITVVGRDGGQLDSNPGYARSDRPGAAMRLLPNVNSVRQLWKRRRVRRDLERLVVASEAVVVRLPSELGLMASALARKHGKMLLTEVVGSAHQSLRHYGSLVARLYAPVADWRMRRAVAASPFVLYVTRKWLQSLYPSASPPVGKESGRAQADVPDAVVVPPGKQTLASREARIASLATSRTPVFGTIATLRGRYKGLQFALAAFAMLRREGLKFEYRILGGGDREPWQSMIEGHGLSDCCFLDGVRPSGEPVLEWLDGIDVHVQPSLTESLGRGTIEALSRGVPCLASSAGGLPDYLDPAWLHPPGNVPALADHLRRLIRDPSIAAQLSQAAFKTALQFDAGQVEAKRAELLAQFAQAARAKREAAGG